MSAFYYIADKVKLLFICLLFLLCTFRVYIVCLNIGRCSYAIVALGPYACVKLLNIVLWAPTKYLNLY